MSFHMLRHIFQYLDTSSLKNVRSCCKSWKNDSCSIFYDKSSVNFLAGNYLRQFLEQEDLVQDIGAQALHYKFQGFDFRDTSTETVHLEAIFDKIGPQVRSLKFTLCAFDKCGKVLGNLLRNLPDLTEICLENCNFIEGVSSDVWLQPSAHALSKFQIVSADSNLNNLPIAFESFWTEFKDVKTLELNGFNATQLLKFLQTCETASSTLVNLTSLALKPKFLFKDGNVSFTGDFADLDFLL